MACGGAGAQGGQINGGVGLDMSVHFGTSYGQSGWFAGGGGGAGYNGNAQGSGGQGGGGSGSGAYGNPGTHGTGGGCGGGERDAGNHQGARGGSGIIILKYQTCRSPPCT